MRLKQEQIVHLAGQIVRNLKRIGCTLKQDERQVAERVERAISKNIQEELEIEEEVKRLMDQYRAQVASGSVDPQRAYQMIKREVARERKFVL